ncbi:MAG: hypothetical protein WC829_08230 [Hyphomicrobium sp.]
MKYLDELESLKLPVGKFAIFGSGPMAVRGIRESADLDIIVKQELWGELLGKYATYLHENPTCLRIGNIEIFKDWPNLADKINEMIDSAEIIAGFPYVQIGYVVEWKTKFGRKKDSEDLELIRKYIDNQKQGQKRQNID